LFIFSSSQKHQPCAVSGRDDQMTQNDAISADIDAGEGIGAKLMVCTQRIKQSTMIGS
jgi:hypothetical protein